MCAASIKKNFSFPIFCVGVVGSPCAYPFVAIRAKLSKLFCSNNETMFLYTTIKQLDNPYRVSPPE